jgi:hypothetical protein
VRRGPPGPRLVSLANQPGDLLVIGAGRRAALTLLVCCPVARHAWPTPTAQCSPSRPRPARHAGLGLRGWAFRHRGLADGSLIDPQVVEALVRSRARVRASALKNLTPRELDVPREMAAGRGTPASPRTCTCRSPRWENTSTPSSPNPA